MKPTKRKYSISYNPNHLNLADMSFIHGGNGLRRAKHLASFHDKLKNKPILASGLHYILGEKKSVADSEAYQIKGFLEGRLMDENKSYIKTPFDSDLILTETKSVDTLTNTYFSYEFIDQILSGSNTKVISVFTDPAHVKRSLFSFDKILPKDVSIIFFPTDHLVSNFDRIYEPTIIKVLRSDFKKIRKLNPNARTSYDDTKNFVEQMHPYYVEFPIKSKYATLIKSGNLAKKIISF